MSSTKYSCLCMEAPCSRISFTCQDWQLTKGGFRCKSLNHREEVISNLRNGVKRIGCGELQASVNNTRLRKIRFEDSALNLTRFMGLAVMPVQGPITHVGNQSYQAPLFYRRCMIEDDRIRNKEDLEKLFPGLPVFQMPEDAEKLTEMLINLKRPSASDVDKIMEEYGKEEN